MPDSLKILVPDFEILVDQKPLPDSIIDRVSQVRVTKVLNASANFSISIIGNEMSLLNMKRELFRKGKILTIKAGYKNNIKQIIIGEIYSVNASFQSSGEISISIEGYDLMHRLARGKYFTKFEDSKSASDIIKEIATNFGLEASIDSTPALVMPVIQYFENYQTVLDRIANLSGYYYWIDEKKLYFKQKTQKKAEIDVEWGEELLDFSATINTDKVVDEIAVRYKDKNETVNDIKELKKNIKFNENNLPSVMKELSFPSHKKAKEVLNPLQAISNGDEAEKLIKSRIEEMKGDLFRGNGTTIGMYDIDVGVILNIKGIKGYEGKYEVYSVTHNINESGYTTNFEIVFNNSLSADNNSVSSARNISSNVIAENQNSKPYSGIMLGKVVDNDEKNNKDEKTEKLGRIKVKFPQLDDDKTDVWACVSTSLAGNDKGLFFLPDIDDEVLVAFENGDVARPYVIGAVWNTKQKPPENKPELRTLKTKKGHTIIISDEDKNPRIEVMDASKKNSIVIDENSISIFGEEISINASKGNISLNAPKGTIRINGKKITQSSGTGGIDVDGGAGAVNIKGITINQN